MIDSYVSVYICDPHMLAIADQAIKWYFRVNYVSPINPSLAYGEIQSVDNGSP